MFSPLAFPTGSVIYDISTSLPPASHLALAPFELYREPLIVVAIADGLNCIGHTDKTSKGAIDTGQGHGKNAEGLLLQGLEKLRDDFPKALVHQVLVFDFDTTKEILPAGVIAVPSLGKSKITTMKTIVCDLTSDLLAEMTTYAKSLQALPTILSPNKAQGVTIPNGYTTQSTEQNDSTSGSSRPSSANGPKQSFSPANELINPLNRSSIPRYMLLEPRKQASTSDSRSVSPHEGTRTPPTTFDEIARVHMSFPSSYNSLHDEKRLESQDRASMQGFGAGSIGERERNKGRGRVGCIIGAIYLLAGRWPDAIRELTESALIAKANSDHLWHAKALDQILVCLLMYAWAGMDFQVSIHNV